MEVKDFEGKKSEYEQELLKYIKKHKIMRWGHIKWEDTSFSKRTAYNYELQNLQSLKDMMENNRGGAMNYLLNKWIASDNATLQIAAMRIVSDDETHQKLNQSYVDHTSKGEKIESNINVGNEWVDFIKKKKEEIEKSVQ